MKISNLLVTDVMILDLKATTKQAAFEEMIDRLYDAGRITDKQAFMQGILAREAQTTTGLGDGIAMPHSKNSAVKLPTVVFARSEKGVEYDAMDGQPVHLLFMIAVPADANNTHLEALASLSRFLLQDGFMDELKAAQTPEAVVELFSEQEVIPEPVTTVAQDASFLVDVTACTTGIAHTYMAEEALKKQAAELGIRIKVEMARFDVKPLINRPVAYGIRQPEELINLALDKQAPIFHSDAPKQQDTETSQSIGKAFYRHLMSGVSSMLPFVIGGGIAIAFAFLIDQSLGVPKDMLSSLGTYHPIAAFFKQIGGAAFGFMLPVLAGYIAYSIAEKPGLVVGFVAGALSANGYNIYNVGLDAKHMPIPSGFLGALVGGFLAGGIILLLKKLLSNLPKSLDGIKTILFYPVLGVLLTGFAMLFINIPMSGINQGLDNFLSGLSGTNAVLLGTLLGGMMAVDMVGPINKAAYVFGTSTLAATVATGGSNIMAAVMAGGMVPPLAVFVATLMFKHKFDKQEREAGLTNIVMGLSFITEGAIPFAAADPVRAIPSFMVGSAVAGGLVGLTGIKLLAPHGGIFVIALTSSPLLYLLFIAIGAVISGVIFGLLKRK